MKKWRNKIIWSSHNSEHTTHKTHSTAVQRFIFFDFLSKGRQQAEKMLNVHLKKRYFLAEEHSHSIWFSVLCWFWWFSSWFHLNAEWAQLAVVSIHYNASWSNHKMSKMWINNKSNEKKSCVARIEIHNIFYPKKPSSDVQWRMKEVLGTENASYSYSSSKSQDKLPYERERASAKDVKEIAKNCRRRRNEWN